MENKVKELKKAKTVPMNTVIEQEVKQEAEAKKPATYSYEELNNIAKQLSEKCEVLYSRCLQYENLLNMKRLDYLFEIVKYKESFDTMFVDECIKEIQEIMTIPEDNSEQGK